MLRVDEPGVPAPSEWVDPPVDEESSDDGVRDDAPLRPIAPEAARLPPMGRELSIEPGLPGAAGEVLESVEPALGDRIELVPDVPEPVEGVVPDPVEGVVPVCARAMPAARPIAAARSGRLRFCSFVDLMMS